MGCGCGRLRKAQKVSKARKKMFDKKAKNNSGVKKLSKSGLISSPGSGRKSGRIKISKKR